VSRKFFGTDGVRGIANTKLTPEFAFALGQAAGIYAKNCFTDGEGHRVVVGSDTRKSGTMLAAALEAGLCSAGVDVLDLGVVPTPAVSYAVRKGDFCMGAIVSASHNPAPDNGIKFVGGSGRKLSDEVEEEIEGLLHSTFDRPSGDLIGTIERGRDPLEGYLFHLQNLLVEGLDGFNIAMDCAHGAAYELAPELLRRLGAHPLLTGVDPDGLNINSEGGATRPETICEFTKHSKAGIGVAFDGDADRVIFCDRYGRLINGDRTMAAWAVGQRAAGKLDPPVVVGTVMSNGGLEQYLKEHGIRLERAPVGDKYVAQAIEATGAKIGGEQSGHIIFPAHGPTGDGMATMLELFGVLLRERLDPSACVDAYAQWPQVLVNVAVASSEGWQGLLEEPIHQAEQVLNGKGRISVRPSGTQPMIRVMVEASDYETRDRTAELLTDAIKEKLHGHVTSTVDLTHALGD
jgi:phosphoglucosamine mutase